MDITISTRIKSFIEAGVRSLNTKPDIKVPRPIPADVKPIKQTVEERAAALQQRAEMDKIAAEFRGKIIQQTGIDPLSVSYKMERKPLTEEEQTAYVQAALDRLMEGDAKYQKLLEYSRQREAEALARQNPLIDTNA